MTLYRVILFVHVTSVTLLFAALALEWLSLRRMASSTSYGQAREWSAVWAMLLPIGMPGILGVLGTGIYLATTVGAWELGWVRVAIPTLVLVAVAGALVGPRRDRLRAVIAQGEGAIEERLRTQLRQPLFVASWRFRAAMLIALVFAMTARPDPVLPVLGLFVVAGVAWGVPAFRERR